MAASVVPRHKQASAVATMFLGLTIANVGGVPAATWLGQVIGWRMSFAATAVLGLVAMLALWTALPAGEAGRRPDLRRELAVLKSPVVLVALLTTVLGAGAMFTLYTYVAPTLAELTGASPGFVTAMLVLIGIGFTIGNTAGGRYADRSLDGSLIAFLVLVIVDMLAFPWLASTQVGAAVGLLIFGFGTFAVVPPLQMRVMRAATEAPGLASSVNVGAFNLGNALGAAAGGAVISAGMGYAAVPVAGALIAVAGLALVLLQRASNQRRNWPLRPAEGRTRRCFAAGFPACRSGRAGSGTACSGADSACAIPLRRPRVSRQAPGLRQARGGGSGFDPLHLAHQQDVRQRAQGQRGHVHDGGREAVLDTRKPITIGVQMDDRLPTKLNTPPVRPAAAPAPAPTPATR